MHERSQLAVKLAAVLFVAAQPAFAGVSVTTSGNQALASMSLSNGSKNFAADVTITFDAPVNLSPAELNLSATLIDPGDATIAARLPPCLIPLLGCVTVDQAFPVLITIEPLNLPWLFASSFESDDLVGNLSFENTYEIEVHTSNLAYVGWSSYRLFKAPVNGLFDDITDEILPGSVRARGRGGSFSQFAVFKDTRSSLVVELLKEANLQTRILAAVLSDALRADLLGLMAALQTAVLALDYATAIVQLDQLITTVQAHAGFDIANTWSSDHTLVDDAGEILGLAQTFEVHAGKATKRTLRTRHPMYTNKHYSPAAILAGSLLLCASAAHAGVSVSTSGNTAIADISLASSGHTYTAQVTISFDSAQNLNPTELNLNAQLVDPLDPGLLARLPPCLLPLLGCVTIDPNFPVLITVEPLNLGAGNLSFTNTYEFEVHTANLTYVPYSRYRLNKAPVNGGFGDITDAVDSGSVRARGRGGSFSQFLVVADTRLSLTVELQKSLNLQVRILSSVLSAALHNQLLGLLTNVTSAVTLGNFTAAIANLDQLINTIQVHAGSDIANVWNANHITANDAGDLLSLAQTLRFTLVRLQNGH